MDANVLAAKGNWVSAAEVPSSPMLLHPQPKSSVIFPLAGLGAGCRARARSIIRCTGTSVLRGTGRCCAVVRTRCRVVDEGGLLWMWGLQGVVLYWQYRTCHVTQSPGCSLQLPPPRRWRRCCRPILRPAACTRKRSVQQCKWSGSLGVSSAVWQRNP